MIHSAPKMLHEKKRRAAFLSEPAICKANPIRFNELCGGRDVSVWHCFCPACALARANSVDPPGMALRETLRPPAIRLY
jgi:hypothetical protein